MNENGVPATIVVVSDRSLVAEAVAAALAGGSELGIVRLRWPGSSRPHRAGWPEGTPPPALGLMMCDLEPPATDTARWVIRAYPTRWLVLTDTPEGPFWGAVLELGILGILPSSTGLHDLLDVIAAARVGDVASLSDRDALVAAWRREASERESVYARMRSLTPREAEVLRQLHLGRSVHEIASLHGVARSTVRSQVRSLLRKLGVSSQLAASAMLDRWGEPAGR